jgi:hypothetical protein
MYNLRCFISFVPIYSEGFIVDYDRFATIRLKDRSYLPSPVKMQVTKKKLLSGTTQQHHRFFSKQKISYDSYQHLVLFPEQGKPVMIMSGILMWFFNSHGHKLLTIPPGPDRAGCSHSSAGRLRV